MIQPSVDRPTCRAITRRGRPCRQRPRRGSDYCAHHDRPRPTPAILPLPNPRDDSLDAEIGAVRATLDRLLGSMERLPAADDGQMARLAPLVFRGAETVARLLRSRRALSGESADGLSSAIGLALDELATQWELPL